MPVNSPSAPRDSLDVQLAADQDRAPEQDCSREVIHLPGSIQQQGFLLAFDPVTEVVRVASANAAEILRVPLKLLLGTSLDTVLDREVLGVVRAIGNDREQAIVVYLGAFRLQGDLWSVVTHIVGANRVLEFERLERLVMPEIMNSVITNFVGKLATITSSLELCQAITRQIRDLTGFNRVLLYSFDDVGHGTVLAEESDGVLPSYLDLRFPSSDIPEQARRLYVLNTVRTIPDANYEPSPLLGLKGPVNDAMDLSHSILRSVSPVHLEYMRNMGTISSMSISIICDGKLWGLISGHHAEPRSVPFLVRSASDMLTKIVGTQLSAFRHASRLSRMLQFHATQRTLLTDIASHQGYVQALFSSIERLLNVTEATGVAVFMDGKLKTAGTTPDDAAIERLIDWLEEEQTASLFETCSLSSLLPWTESIADVASGVIAIRISDVLRSFILWFRPEVLNTVKWAGEPVKYQDAAAHLHPRASFEVWKETVTGQAEPWADVEIESAREFRSALLTISLKRAEETAQLNEARFQQLTHAVPALVWTADNNGNLTYVNDRWRELGLPEGGLWYRAAVKDPSEHAGLAERWKAAVMEGTLFEEDVPVPTKSGGERWHLVRAVPFAASDRQRAGWIGTLVDTTDRREREEALRMAEKLATTGRMTSVIAHEINNPLESITNLMYLLRGEIQGSHHAEEYIALAESELERISGITKQTLRWGRDRREQVEAISVAALFDDVLRLFAGKLRNRQVQLERREVSGAECFGIVGQVRQVLANLLANAIDAVPVGGRVWLDAQTDDRGTSLIVGDNGSGMNTKQMEQLFTPFYSTKGDLGNGLGLYITKEIVDRHKGQLLVDTEVGKGTVMTVRLPLPLAKSGVEPQPVFV